MKLKIASFLAAIASATALLLLFTGKQQNGGISMMENKEIEEAFVQYIAKYGKTYASKEEVTKRFDNFARSYKIIQNHNYGSEKSFQMELNQFADMDRSERMKGIQVGDLETFKTRRKLFQNDTQVTKEVDWRQSGNVSPVLNQGTCGSCWAFSTVSTLEAAFSIRNQANYTKSLSIQYLVDCDTYNVGCMGGLQFRAYKYIRENGFYYLNDYYFPQYLSSKRQCMATKSQNKQYKRSLVAAGSLNGTAEEIMNLVSYQPLGIAINTPDCFMLYKSGVFKETESCKCGIAGEDESPLITHAVTLVGYSMNNQTEGCAGYWIVQNSWGLFWGESGFFRLCIPLQLKENMAGTCNSQYLTMYPDLGLLPSA